MALRDVRVRADALSGVWQTTSLDTLIPPKENFEAGIERW